MVVIKTCFSLPNKLELLPPKARRIEDVTIFPRFFCGKKFNTYVFFRQFFGFVVSRLYLVQAVSSAW